MLDVGVLPPLRQLEALLALGLLAIAQAAAAAACAAKCGAMGAARGLPPLLQPAARAAAAAAAAPAADMRVGVRRPPGKDSRAPPAVLLLLEARGEPD